MRIVSVPQNASIALPLGYDASAEPHEGKKVAIFFHVHYAEMVGDICALLADFPVSADLFVTTNTFEKDVILTRTLFQHYKKGRFEVSIVANKGRDIWPKFGAQAWRHTVYDYVLHLHTKHSPHNENLKGWRDFLWQHLASRKAVLAALEIFDECPDVGIVSPQHLDFIRKYVEWNGNYEIAWQLAKRMGLTTTLPDAIDFPSGSMFWARTAAIAPILDLKMKKHEFPPEDGQVDNTPAHAIERLIYVACELAGFKWVRVAIPQMFCSGHGIKHIASRSEIAQFVAMTNVSLLAPQAAM